MKVSQYSHNIAEKCAALTGSGDFDDIYWQYLLLEAPHLFESYLLYMEKNRPDSKKFYIPRRKTLHVVAQDLQDLEERKIEFYGLSLPSRVGKAISYDTPVLTDNGWKKHGELTILDRVIGIDGEFKKFLQFIIHVIWSTKLHFLTVKKLFATETMSGECSTDIKEEL